MNFLKVFWIKFFMLVCLCAPAFAVIEPSEISEDPALEQTAREIFKSLRCPSCTHQPLLESEAESSKQLRLLIRKKLESGQSPQEIDTFLANYYGEGIFLTPRKTHLAGLLIWIIPGVLFVFALLVFIFMMRRGKPTQHHRTRMRP